MADSALGFQRPELPLAIENLASETTKSANHHTPCAWPPWAFILCPHLRLECHSQQPRNCFIFQEHSPAQKSRSSRRGLWARTEEASVPHAENIIKTLLPPYLRQGRKMSGMVSERKKALISPFVNKFSWLQGKGPCQIVFIARGGLRLQLGGTDCGLDSSRP